MLFPFLSFCFFFLQHQNSVPIMLKGAFFSILLQKPCGIGRNRHGAFGKLLFGKSGEDRFLTGLVGAFQKA